MTEDLRTEAAAYQARADAERVLAEAHYRAGGDVLADAHAYRGYLYARGAFLASWLADLKGQ